MITEHDKNSASELQAYLNKQMNLLPKMPNGDFYQMVKWQETIDRMVSNLVIAPLSYRDNADPKFYTASCSICGWFGSSSLLDGGGQIADTGDYGDCYCPVCGNTNIDEK